MKKMGKKLKIICNKNIVFLLHLLSKITSFYLIVPLNSLNPLKSNEFIESYLNPY